MMTTTTTSTQNERTKRQEGERDKEQQIRTIYAHSTNNIQQAREQQKNMDAELNGTYFHIADLEPLIIMQ